MLNRFAPPSTAVESASGAPVRHARAFTIAALALVQFGLASMRASGYFELINSGAVSLTAGLVGLVCSLLLYVASLRFALDSRSGKRTFLSAGLGLAWAAFAFHVPLSWAFPLWLGSLVAFAGWWLVVRGRWAAADDSCETL